eukprot:5595810-Prymnesium_polylepis.1
MQVGVPPATVMHLLSPLQHRSRWQPCPTCGHSFACGSARSASNTRSLILLTTASLGLMGVIGLTTSSTAARGGAERTGAACVRAGRGGFTMGGEWQASGGETSGGGGGGGGLATATGGGGPGLGRGQDVFAPQDPQEASWSQVRLEHHHSHPAWPCVSSLAHATLMTQPARSPRMGFPCAFGRPRGRGARSEGTRGQPGDLEWPTGCFRHETPWSSCTFLTPL